MLNVVKTVLVGVLLSENFCYSFSTSLCNSELEEIRGSKVGGFMLIRKPVSRNFDSSSCFKELTAFLRPYSSPPKKAMSPKKLARLWLHLNKKQSNETFSGPRDTVAVFQEGITYNLLLDVDYTVQRFLLRNERTDAYSIHYKSEEDIMKFFLKNEAYLFTEVMECQHLVFYLSKTYGALKASVTLVRRNSSEEEASLIAISGGLAGFIKA